MNEEIEYLKEDPKQILGKYQKTSSTEWQKLGETSALKLFQEAAHRIPAYKDFLKKNKVDPDKIQTYDDFKLLPLVDKENYLKKYPLHSLTWEGDLKDLYILSSSSGSTGLPYLWPRGSVQEVEGARFVELFYKYMFDMDRKSTLYVVSFGMGTWIAGTFMTAVTELVSKKGYPTLIITPGLEKDLLLGLIKQMQDDFDQLLIIGYPPFVKDILDSGKNAGLDWPKLNVKLMFAAEGFSEQWRDYVLKKIGSGNPLKSSTNIYGTADSAIMGMETPISILLRRSMLKKDMLQEFFGDNRQPTVLQYDPTQRFFEKIGDELVFTANSGIPLIRYNIHDTGELLSYDQVKIALEKINVSIPKELNKYDCQEFNWHLPFLYIFGRSNFMVNFYGLGIFPEHIKAGLEDTKVSNIVTGKFNMRTETDKRHNQKLVLNIELQVEQEPNKLTGKLILESILKHLQELNSEFNKLYKELGQKKATPIIELFTYGDPQFKIGAKHRWVKINKD